MKRTSNTLLLLLLSLLFFSCGRDFYVPYAGNHLILQEKNDLKAGVGINTVQLAYSPLGNLGIKSDFAFTRLRNDNRDRNINNGTFGIGYYSSKEVKPLFPNTIKEYQRPQKCAIGYDIFANVAWGQIVSRNNPTAPGIGPSISFNSFEADIFRPNITGQIYWQSKTFTVNLGMRYSVVNYLNATGFGTFTEFELTQLRNIVDNSPLHVVDYDLKVSKGDNNIQSFISANWNQSLGLLQDNNTTISFGLSINVSNFIQHRKSDEPSKSKPTAKKRKQKKRK